MLGFLALTILRIKVLGPLLDVIPLPRSKQEYSQYGIPERRHHAREYVCEEKVLEFHWPEWCYHYVPKSLQELGPRSQIEDVEREAAQDDEDYDQH